MTLMEQFYEFDDVKSTITVDLPTRRMDINDLIALGKTTRLLEENDFIGLTEADFGARVISKNN